MIVEPFQQGDVAGFLELAAREGWIAEAWEFDFLLSAFPAGCFTARDREGTPCGYVTSLRHERSGWIGNLIVDEQSRGRGVGAALFNRALGALRSAGVSTCWLTASPSGKSLYEKQGFVTIDTIIRWCGTGRQRHVAPRPTRDNPEATLPHGGIDLMAWGDRRNRLLQEVVGRGVLLREDDGFLVVQPGAAACQFGPFAALDYGSASRLFDTALSTVPRGGRFCMDVPHSNRAAARMLQRRGALVAGSAELMYAGARPAYRGEYLYGLATMGSCG